MAAPNPIQSPVAFPSNGALASLNNRDQLANGVAANAPLGNAVSEARVEERVRELLRSHEPAAVTVDEFEQSRRRRVAIETMEAQVAYGVGHGVLAVIPAQLHAIQTQLTAMEAKITNVRRRERNRTNNWTYILVEHGGPNPIGAPPPIHPADRDSVLTMRAHEVDALEQAFNLPAGRFAGPNIGARRIAVLTYLTEG